MRINKLVALATGMSRRDADTIIAKGTVKVNGQPALAGQNVSPEDSITVSGRPISLPQTTTTIMLNKPPGYVVSRDGQGSQTIYDLLPPELHKLKPVGRLDKDSSGLLLLTSDGQLAHELTHPKFNKQKIYEIKLNKPLATADKIKIEQGIQLDDGLSKLRLRGGDKNWIITMHEGRNRQIRRTFANLNYQVTKLHRTTFGDYTINALALGEWHIIDQPVSPNKH